GSSSVTHYQMISIMAVFVIMTAVRSREVFPALASHFHTGHLAAPIQILHDSVEFAAKSFFSDGGKGQPMLRAAEVNGGCSHPFECRRRRIARQVSRRVVPGPPLQAGSS